VSEKSILLSDDAPIAEMEELRPLIAEGQERGFVTFDEIRAWLEESEVSKEQVQELHAYLDDQGIEVVDRDGRPAKSEGSSVEAAAVPALDRTRSAAHRRAGGHPGQAH
jgi:RNA polymerase primary sigma factor